MVAQQENHQLGDLCFFLLRKSGILLPKKEFLKHLYTNENDASLLAVTETMSYFGIETLCVRTDIEFIRENKAPVLVHLTSGAGAGFVLLFDFLSADRVKFRDEKLKVRTASLGDLLASWDGAALFVVSAKRNYRRSYQSILRKCLVVCFGLLFVRALYQSFVVSPFYLLFFCLKIGGLFITFLLIRHALGKTSAIEQKICTFHRRVDCDAVLSSGAAQIGEIASMSDIGFVYFTSGIAVLLIGLLTAQKESYLDVLCLLSYVSFFYTLFSLFYQRMIVKKWCPLCLGVVAVIWAECAVGYVHAIFSFPPLETIVVVWFVFMLVSLVWKTVYALVQERNRLEKIEYAYLKLKKDSTVFASLAKPVFMSGVPVDFTYPLICGYRDAEKLLTVVLSFSCYPCRNLFDKMKAQLLSEENRLLCRFVFLAKSKNDNAEIELLTGLYREKGENAFLTALSNRFDEPEWEESETEEVSISQPCGIAEEHRIWIKQRSISYTPAILSEDKKIPLWYDWDEIVYFLN